MSDKNPQVFNYINNFKIAHARKVMLFYFGESFIKAYKNKDLRTYVCRLVEPSHPDPAELERLNNKLFKKMRNWQAYWGKSYEFEFGEMIKKGSADESEILRAQ